jgi:predicted nucleotidyltransferase
MPQLELSRLDLAARHVATLKAILATQIPQAQVWVYGSRVTGHAHEGSDLDLVLRNTHDLKQEVFGLDGLIVALQESNLPILVDVHQWASLPKSFHQNIEAAYIEIQ